MTHPQASLWLTQAREWAQELGFSQIGVAGVDLSTAEPGLLAWLGADSHGGMHYMEAHGLKRARPAELVPGTLSIITARMDYLPPGQSEGWQAVEWSALGQPAQAYVSMYARGRDYHKVLRSRLQTLAERVQTLAGPFGHRVFTDSAPVLECELAARSGLGWRGKHSLVLHREAGSMFFLGEIFTTLPLPPTPPTGAHCGTCTDCIDACPTGAIVGPGRVDARRCISYLTIEHEGSIDAALRPHMGNRIYGCDDCQLACPWNKFAKPGRLPDFAVRQGLDSGGIASLLAWTEAEFLSRTEGSAIRRIGHRRWLRNLAIAAGNAGASQRGTDDEAPRSQIDSLRAALATWIEHPDAVVREAVQWGLDRLAAELPS